ncbi:MAG: biotin transporter BioY [Bacillota bacterium]|nr:biotin transporter BioY [Bacillota bacterium]
MSTGFKQTARGDLRLLVFSALLMALLAVFSQISINLAFIPINLALLAVFLIGFLLPIRWAMGTVGVYLLLGAAGIPVFAGFKAGVQALFGYTGGYLLGYLFSAAVIASLSERADSFFKRFLLCLLALLVCYLPGTLWFMQLTGRSLGEALTLTIFPFIPGDLLKCLAAALLAGRLKTALRLC